MKLSQEAQRIADRKKARAKRLEARKKKGRSPALAAGAESAESLEAVVLNLFGIPIPTGEFETNPRSAKRAAD